MGWVSLISFSHPPNHLESKLDKKWELGHGSFLLAKCVQKKGDALKSNWWEACPGTWVNGYMGTWVHSYMLRERKESPRIFDLLIQTYDYICIKCCYISDMIESRWDSNACLPHTGTHNGCPDNTTRTENRQHRDRASQWQYCGRGQLVLWQQSGSCGSPTQQCAVAALGPRPCSLRICDLVFKWKEIMHWLIMKNPPPVFDRAKRCVS